MCLSDMINLSNRDFVLRELFIDMTCRTKTAFFPVWKDLRFKRESLNKKSSELYLQDFFLDYQDTVKNPNLKITKEKKCSVSEF